MNAVIVLGGVSPAPGVLRAFALDAGLIVCADSGAAAAVEAGIRIDALLGDMDSISAETLATVESMGAEIRRFSTEKDEIDGQLAVDFCVARGAKKAFLLGAGGNRPDHAYASMMLLYRLERAGVEAWQVDEGHSLRVTTGKVMLEGWPGRVVSLLPFGGDAILGNTHGLLYPVEIPKAFSMDQPLGVSNVMITDTAALEIFSGYVLVVAENKLG